MNQAISQGNMICVDGCDVGVTVGGSDTHLSHGFISVFFSFYLDVFIALTEVRLVRIHSF